MMVWQSVWRIKFALLFFLRANAVAVFARLCAQGRACFFGGGESEAKNGALYAARKFLNLVKMLLKIHSLFLML